jgi:hypothetical protein
MGHNGAACRTEEEYEQDACYCLDVFHGYSPVRKLPAA